MSKETQDNGTAAVTSILAKRLLQGWLHCTRICLDHKPMKTLVWLINKDCVARHPQGTEQSHLHHHHEQLQVRHSRHSTHMMTQVVMCDVYVTLQPARTK